LADYRRFGVILAVFAGSGYGIFLVVCSHLKLKSSLKTINSLMLFATLYLAIPFFYHGAQAISNWHVLLLLVGLSFLPTIAGFWFTIHALTLLNSESVQLLELNEPIFSIFLAVLFLGQMISYGQIIGGMLILLAVVMDNISTCQK